MKGANDLLGSLAVGLHLQFMEVLVIWVLDGGRDVGKLQSFRFGRGELEHR